jgi:flagellar protein FlaG
MNVQPVSKVPDQPYSTGVAAGSAQAAPSRISEPTEPAREDKAVKASASQASATPEQMRQVSDMLNKEISRVSQSLRFSVDQQTGKTVIKVLDSSTDEVIRQIPSEEALNISQALDRLQGLLLKGKA